MSICQTFLAHLRQGMAPWVMQRLNNAYGDPPTDDPSAFSFYVALILPIDEHEKAKLLPLRSARLRLRLVVHWIEQLNNNWCVFSLGVVLFVDPLVGGLRAVVLFCNSGRTLFLEIFPFYFIFASTMPLLASHLPYHHRCCPLYLHPTIVILA